MKASLFIKSQAATGQRPQDYRQQQPQRQERRRTGSCGVWLNGRGLLPPGDADVDGGGRDGLHARHDAGVLARVLAPGPGQIEAGLQGAVAPVLHLDPANTKTQLVEVMAVRKDFVTGDVMFGSEIFWWKNVSPDRSLLLEAISVLPPL